MIVVDTVSLDCLCCRACHMQLVKGKRRRRGKRRCYMADCLNRLTSRVGILFTIYSDEEYCCVDRDKHRQRVAEWLPKDLTMMVRTVLSCAAALVAAVFAKQFLVYFGHQTAAA